MNINQLQPLGWSNYFFQQLTIDEIASINNDRFLFRITAIHRNRVVGIGLCGERGLIVPDDLQPTSQFLAVGDWVIAEQLYEHFKICRPLLPKNRIERLSNDANQMIAANLDYLWVVTSANEEFNIKRLQRYLATAYEFDIEAVIVLTKTDLTDNVEHYLDQLFDLNVYNIHAVNGQDLASYHPLDVYFKSGNSIAMVGSSGVGKSTLINMLAGTEQLVNAIRYDDSKGKHTTTHREMFFCKNDTAIIDTPGMRELQLMDATKGIDVVFEQIISLAEQCKFNNCGHDSEPNCAVKAAIADGVLSEVDYNNYQKLLREDEYQRRKAGGAYAAKQYFREFSKMIKAHKVDKY